MERKLFVTVPTLKEYHRTAIREVCERYNITVDFLASEAEALQRADEPEILFGNIPQLAETAANLKWMCSNTAGINHFTQTRFVNGDIMLSNSSGAYGVTIAEHIVMLILDILRRMPEYNEIVANRQWIKNLAVRSILGSRVAMLGTGDIGTETALRIKAFKPASITGISRSGRELGEPYDRAVKSTDMDEVLKQTDILIMSLPGTVETNHMLNAERLSLLPDGAVIINVGRGNSIDQKALEKELRAGRLYAGLDVFEEEPIAADDTLWNCPNLIITPHAAGNMTLPYTVDRIADMFIEDLERYLTGKEPLRKVCVKTGY